MQAIESQLHLLNPFSGGKTGPESNWNHIFLCLEIAVKSSFIQVSSWKPSEEETEPYIAHLFQMDIFRKEWLLTVAQKLSHRGHALIMLHTLNVIIKDLCDDPHAQTHVPADFLEAVGEVASFAEASTNSTTWSHHLVRRELEELKDALQKCKPLRLGAAAKEANVHDRLLSSKVCRLASDQASFGDDVLYCVISPLATPKQNGRRM